MPKLAQDCEVPFNVVQDLLFLSQAFGSSTGWCQEPRLVIILRKSSAMGTRRSTAQPSTVVSRRMDAAFRSKCGAVIVVVGSIQQLYNSLKVVIGCRSHNGTAIYGSA